MKQREDKKGTYSDEIAVPIGPENTKGGFAAFPLVLLCSFLIGCGTTKPVTRTVVRLNALQCGETTKTEVMAGFGSPSGLFNEQSILTYRLGLKKGIEYPVLEKSGSWKGVHYSLVLVFDQCNILEDYSLVPVR